MIKVELQRVESVGPGECRVIPVGKTWLSRLSLRGNGVDSLGVMAAGKVNGGHRATHFRATELKEARFVDWNTFIVTRGVIMEHLISGNI